MTPPSSTQTAPTSSPCGAAREGAENAPVTSSGSYREALKATALTGFANFAELVIGLAKSKVIAVKVGPEGIGLFGILTAVTGLVSSVTSLGITSSGVRQVAAAAGAGDTARIARVIYTLRRTSLVLGLLGSGLLAVLATPLAKMFAGSAEHARWLLLLAPMILLGSVNGGQLALLRGLRRIGDLTRLRLIGAAAGTAFAVPLVWFLGWLGIPLAMLATSACSLGASWWYARRVRTPRPELSAVAVWSEARQLFALGAAFLLTGLQGPVVQNALRAILIQQTDLATVGQFLAAFALSHTYVNFVLQAMGMDYLPRLSRYHDNPVTLNRLVNEQTEIALLIAAPGVVALVVLAPLLIPLLYSHRFDAAIAVFQWQCLGVLLKVASWALGFAVVAQNRRTAFVVTETLSNLFYVAVFFVLVRFLGLAGAAMSFAVLYLAYLGLIYFTVRMSTGFTWSPGARSVFLTGLGAVILAVVVHECLNGWPQWTAGFALVALVAVWSYRQLERRLGVALVPKALALLRKRIQSVEKSPIRP